MDTKWNDGTAGRTYGRLSLHYPSFRYGEKQFFNNTSIPAGGHVILDLDCLRTNAFVAGLHMQIPLRLAFAHECA